jgi:hypothetical protein
VNSWREIVADKAGFTGSDDINGTAGMLRQRM